MLFHVIARLSKLRSKTPLGVKIDFFAYQNFDNIRNYPLLWKNIKHVYAKTYGSLNLVCFFAIIDVLKYSLLLEYHQYLNDIQAAVYELSDPTNIS